MQEHSDLERDLHTGSEPRPVGKRETLIAAGLAALCLLTALSTWIYGIRPKENVPDESAGAFSTALFQDKADVGTISIEGAILHQANSGGFGGSTNASSDRIVAEMRRAEKAGVKALLLKINSPGGTASASQSIYAEIQRLRKAKMRIYSAMGDVAASGGYYIASATEKIYANPATLTGSIGVISQSMKVKGLFEKLGLEAEVIKSGAFKDMGSPYRPTSPAERELLQNLINDTYLDFVQAVAQGRKLPIEQVKTLGDGRIYTGNQALKHKLVDALGDYNVALADLRKASQLSESASVRDFSKPGFEEIVSLLGARVQSWSPTASLEQISHADLRHLNKVPLMLYY